MTYADTDPCPKERLDEPCINCNETWGYHQGWKCSNVSSNETYKGKLKSKERYLTKDMQMKKMMKCIRGSIDGTSLIKDHVYEILSSNDNDDTYDVMDETKEINAWHKTRFVEIEEIQQVGTPSDEPMLSEHCSPILHLPEEKKFDFEKYNGFKK